MKKANSDTKELQEFAKNKVSQVEQHDIGVEAMQKWVGESNSVSIAALSVSYD